jgi:hypothetical protein
MPIGTVRVDWKLYSTEHLKFLERQNDYADDFNS